MGPTVWVAEAVKDFEQTNRILRNIDILELCFSITVLYMLAIIFFNTNWINQNEYLSLVEQCMDFACELMDLCRGTQEVQAMLGDEHGENSREPLARLRLAIHYGEKKVGS